MRRAGIGLLIFCGPCRCAFGGGGFIFQPDGLELGGDGFGSFVGVGQPQAADDEQGCHDQAVQRRRDQKRHGGGAGLPRSGHQQASHAAGIARADAFSGRQCANRAHGFVVRHEAVPRRIRGTGEVGGNGANVAALQQPQNL
jgi:hypothetical protein